MQLEDRDREMWTVWRVLREGASAAPCAEVAKSGLTHFITSLFLSFVLPPSLCSILECRRQASRHFCIYFTLLCIHGFAPPAAFLRQMYLPHKLGSFDIPYPVFFMGHYIYIKKTFGTFKKLCSVQDRKDIILL